MLNNDIPFTLSEGPWGKEIVLYGWRFSGYDFDEPYIFEQNTKAKSFKNHFVTVTGMIVDNVKNQRYLKISSWGSEYYIDYDAYLENMTEGSNNRVFTNILYIYQK